MVGAEVCRGESWLSAADFAAAVILQLCVVAMRWLSHQLIESTFEAAAAGTRYRQQSPIEALTNGLGHPTDAMAYAVDRTDHSVATVDHLLDAL